MAYYRIRCSVPSTFLTPWQADTIFGTLCWTLRLSEGEDALAEFLAPFRERKPPFLLSSGFPGDALPAPATLRLPGERRDLDADGYTEMKKRKRARFLRPADFARTARGEEPLLEEMPPDIDKTTTLHATISRTHGTTGDEGSFYELPEMFVSSARPEISVYLWTEEETVRDHVAEFFDRMSHAGFGKKKSVGKGAFSVLGVESWSPPDLPGAANGFVTFAPFCPAKTDPTDGHWSYRVKYGKLGEHFAKGGNPFKKPCLFLEEGSVFRTVGAPAGPYGRMVEGLSDAHPEVVQYAFAFPVPMMAPDAGQKLEGAA